MIAFAGGKRAGPREKGRENHPPVFFVVTDVARPAFLAFLSGRAGEI